MDTEQKTEKVYTAPKRTPPDSISGVPSILPKSIPNTVLEAAASATSPLLWDMVLLATGARDKETLGSFFGATSDIKRYLALALGVDEDEFSLTPVLYTSITSTSLADLVAAKQRVYAAHMALKRLPFAEGLPLPNKL